MEPGRQECAIGECDGCLGRHAQVEVCDVHAAALQVHVGLLYFGIHRKVTGTQEVTSTLIREETKPSLFADDMMVYVENPKKTVF